MFQFDADDLALKVGAQRVRAQLPSPWSGWTVASWFATPNARLDGRSPVDMIDSRLDAVARAARSVVKFHDVTPARERQANDVVAQA